MNRYIIVDGLPYLLDNGKVYCVRWDESGFTVGAEVEMASVPNRTYSELSIKAKCAGRLDSISAKQSEQEDDNAEGENTEDQQSDEPGNASEAEQEDGNAEDDEQKQSEQEDEPEAVEESEKAIEDMTLAELKDYAEEHGIKLGSARTKGAIIELINASETADGDAE